MVSTNKSGKRLSLPYIAATAMLLILAFSSSSYAQGSIFGTVRNSDATIPAAGAVSFVGYLNNTDEEIRLESSIGAGYDAGNWFDDFQNYLTEVPGNPYTYRFSNLANGEAFWLNGIIPSSSFHQQDVTLAPAALPVAPSGLTATTTSLTNVVISWIAFPGLTYHVYRRAGTSNGSFFRIDNTAGLLTNPGVAVNYFVDNTTGGVGTFDYVVIAQDASGQFSPHSLIISADAAAITGPVVTSVNPNNGTAVGGTAVSILGSGFDIGGTNATIGSFSLISIIVVSPFEITGITQSGPIGPADVSVTNLASGLSSTLVAGFLYNANSPPVLALIGPQTVTEPQTLTFSTSATDPEGGFPVMTTGPLPSTATYVDNGDGTGTFNWVTSFTDAGVFPVTFFASDAVAPTLVDSEVVTITVLDGGNQTPVLAPIADTTVPEAALLAFTISATDADGTIPGLSATGLPLNATFLDNGDGTGSFNFTPDLTQAGIYIITFKAVDAALSVDSAVVTITVTETNQVPVLALIGPQTTTENVLISLRISATDGDGVIPVLRAVGLPPGAIFVDSLNGAGSFDWLPTFTDAGTHLITFMAEDGALPGVIDSEVVTITVLETGNQPPVMALINDTTIIEGTVLSILVTAVDADGTIPVLTVTNLPVNASFIDNADGTGSFSFAPSFLQNGVFPVSFFASDGILVDSQVVTITVVDAGNVPPVITPIADTTIPEGQQLVISVSVTDPDGTGVEPLISATSSLSNLSVIDNRDGTATLTYLPNFFDSGVDTVRVFAVDFGTPQQTSILDFVVTTIEVNQAPSFALVGPLGVIVGNTLTFTVFATDSTDQDTTKQLLLSAIDKPPNSFFTDNGNSSGTFTIIPTQAQAGVDTVTFLVVDQGVPALSSTMDVEIRIVTENIPPILDPIGPQALVEGGKLNLLITGSDPDGPPPTIEAIGLPANAFLTPISPGSAAFSFSPDFTQSGLFAIKFRAFDGITVTDEIVLIQVTEAGDQAPVFDSIPAPSIVENNTLTTVITAFDPDTLAITLSLVQATAPPNLTFVDSGNGVGVITFSPDFTQAGTYLVDIVADDGTQQTTITITIVVIDAGNQLPVLAPLSDQIATELLPLTFTVTAADPDGDAPILTMVPSAPNIPLSAFTDNGSGIGQFSWTPTALDSGIFLVKFFAEDGAFPGIFDSTEISITVADTNRLPIIFTGGLETVFEGDSLNFSISAVDLDGTIPFLGARLDGTDTLATNMTFVDNRDGTGTLIYKPAFDVVLARTGFVPFFVRFFAIDEADSTLIVDASSNVQIQVQAKNQPPTLIFPNGAGPFSLVEGTNLQFLVAADDSDGVQPPIVVAESLPVNSSFTVVVNAGTFSFDPDFTQAAVYNVRFIAIDEDLGADTQIVQITVTDAGNQPPLFSTVLPDTINVAAGTQSVILVEALDPDSDLVTLTASPVDPALPFGFFRDNNDGTGNYSYTPTTGDVGRITLVTFISSDGLVGDTIFTNLQVVAFLRGDVDGNNKYTMNDLVVLITYLFRSGPAPSSIATADTDGDGAVNILDITYLINFLYYGGPQPPQ